MSKEKDALTVHDAVFASRPLVLPGTAFGCINLFFDPKELDPGEVEKMLYYVTAVIDDYFETLEKVSISSNYRIHTKQ